MTNAEQTASDGRQVGMGLGLWPKRKGISMKMTKGGRYNWSGQSERLVYLGENFSGNGYWHQFAKVESPGVVWCEVKGYQLEQFEEATEPEPEWPNDVAAAFGGLVQKPQG